MNLLIRSAFQAGQDLYADFVETDRNRIMYITYAFAGFSEVDRQGDRLLLKLSKGDIPPLPTHLKIISTVPGLG
jgi:hypothetical protein